MWKWIKRQYSKHSNARRKNAGLMEKEIRTAMVKMVEQQLNDQFEACFTPEYMANVFPRLGTRDFGVIQQFAQVDAYGVSFTGLRINNAAAIVLTIHRVACGMSFQHVVICDGQDGAVTVMPCNASALPAYMLRAVETYYNKHLANVVKDMWISREDTLPLDPPLQPVAKPISAGAADNNVVRLKPRNDPK